MGGEAVDRGQIGTDAEECGFVPSVIRCSLKVFKQGGDGVSSVFPQRSLGNGSLNRGWI